MPAKGDHLSLLGVLVLLLAASARAAEPAPDLVIYAYDSFAAKGGLGPEIVPIFEKSCACKVSVLPSGDGGQLLNRVQLDAEARRKGAHLVVGLDQSIWKRAKPFIEGWDGWKPKGLDRVESPLRVEEGFLPFDYGVFAFMADKQALEARKVPAPRSLKDLLAPAFKRSLLLEDPRTSTPGLAFLIYTNVALGGRKGEERKPWDFWRDLRSQWLTLSPGWDQAYGLFLKGEAPLVWSYVTSQAYHVEHGEPSRYAALLFDEGNPVQIEGAAIVKGALQSDRERKLARGFLEFLLTPEVQSRIPLTNWMYPVVKATKLPPSFEKLPKPRITYSMQVDEGYSSAILKSWARVIQGGKP
jgi:thiamine transport system substrate-binding protein